MVMVITVLVRMNVSLSSTCHTSYFTTVFFFVISDSCTSNGLVCDSNAICAEGKCKCRDGYNGNGQICQG